MSDEKQPMSTKQRLALQVQADGIARNAARFDRAGFHSAAERARAHADRIRGLADEGRKGTSGERGD